MVVTVHIFVPKILCSLRMCTAQIQHCFNHCTSGTSLELSCFDKVCSKRDISPSEGHFTVKTIMAAILKARSKPKCSKLATSKGRSEWRISKGTTDGHFGPPWSFAQILCMMTVPPCGHGMMTQKGSLRNSCLVPYTLHPFEALTPDVISFEGIRA